MNAWYLVAGAIGAEVAAALALRRSHGFRRPVPTLAALLAFAAAFYLASRAMLGLPVSVVYPVWAGGGTAGVALCAAVLLHERFAPLKIGGTALVLAGIVLLNLSAGGA